MPVLQTSGSHDSSAGVPKSLWGHQLQVTSHSKWIFTAANGRYLVGDFDGDRFTPETEPLRSDYGPHFYAVQTYSDISPRDGRRLQMAWMRGGTYPEMPFNQQMSVPCELTLRRTPEGLRLHRQPIRELRTLAASERTWRNLPVGPAINANLLAGLTGELWDIEAILEPGQATAFGLRVWGHEIRYSVPDHSLSCAGCIAPLKPAEGQIHLHVLVDRTSLEVFGNHGAVSLTCCFLPQAQERPIALYAEGGNARLLSLKARQLRSIWRSKEG
jgi:levanase/fructan beta-fructosidase